MLDGVILAAGYGTRLLPITKIIPKPLVPICDEPIILHVMQRMWNFGIRRFFINVHYRKDKIIDAIKSSKFRENTNFQIEDELLLTGGGLRGLLCKVYTDNAIVHNVDIIEEFDYERLIAVHKAQNNDITWVLTKHKGNVILEKDRIIGFSENGLTFTGVGIYKRDIIKYMPDDKFSLIPWIKNMLREKKLKMGYIIEKGFWQDVGTPHGIFKACSHILDNEGKKVDIKGDVVGSILFSGHVFIGKGVKIKGNGFIKDAVILGTTLLEGNIEIEKKIIYNGVFASF